MSLALVNVSFGYAKRPELLRDASLRIHQGESVSLMAPSGEGKSTVLSIAGLLLAPHSGEVLIDGLRRTPKDASRLLGTAISWLPQSVNLLPRRSLLDNVALALLSRGHDRRSARGAAEHWIHAVGLEGKGAQQARTLSGGEAQRTGIARALATQPSILIADEPTANLDSATARSVAASLLGAATSTTVIIATHDARIGELTDRVVVLEGGTFHETARV